MQFCIARRGCWVQSTLDKRNPSPRRAVVAALTILADPSKAGPARQRRRQRVVGRDSGEQPGTRARQHRRHRDHTRAPFGNLSAAGHNPSTLSRSRSGTLIRSASVLAPRRSSSRVAARWDARSEDPRFRLQHPLPEGGLLSGMPYTDTTEQPSPKAPTCVSRVRRRVTPALPAWPGAKPTVSCA